MKCQYSINLNDTVRVRLTDFGRKKLEENWLAARLPSRFIYTPKKEDADGYSEWQLWNLFEEFGTSVHIGFNVPFETEILIK